MRHGKSGRKLGRTASHRKATLSSLSVSLFRHKRITTTVAKAKETRMVVEKLITRAKNAVAGETEEKGKNVHARRHVFSLLRDRDAVTTLFNEIAPKVATRPGGYTRVVKLGRRLGDGAEMAIIELVDFNVAGEKAATAARKSVSKKSRKAEGDTQATAVDTKAAETEKSGGPKPDPKLKTRTKGKKSAPKDSSSAKS